MEKRDPPVSSLSGKLNHVSSWRLFIHTLSRKMFTGKENVSLRLLRIGYVNGVIKISFYAWRRANCSVNDAPPRRFVNRAEAQLNRSKCELTRRSNGFLSHGISLHRLVDTFYNPSLFNARFSYYRNIIDVRELYFLRRIST